MTSTRHLTGSAPALPSEAVRRHYQLGQLIASPEHDSDCEVEAEGPRSRIGTPCTCTTGRLARVAAAVLHAHRPDDAGLCSGDGVLCVDGAEDRHAWPCPTVRLIAHAIDDREVVDG